MYKADIVKEKVKNMLKSSGKSQKDVLSAAGTNENTLNQMSDTKGISSFVLARIADELNCSVDYLLGRDNKPQATASEWETLLSGLSDESLIQLRDYVRYLVWKQNQADQAE